MRSRRRFVASLEPFTHVRLSFRMRPHADLCFLESAEIVRAARNVARDLDRYAYSTYVVEVVDCMVEGREAEPAVFDLAEELLGWIDSSFPAPLHPDGLRYFESRLLALTGLEPKLDSCLACARRAGDEAALFRFNPRDGTLACSSCSDGSGIPVSSEAVSSMLSLRRRSLRELPQLGGKSGAEARVLLQSFIMHHARRPLRSPALLRDILGL